MHRLCLLLRLSRSNLFPLLLLLNRKGLEHRLYRFPLIRLHRWTPLAPSHPSIQSLLLSRFLRLKDPEGLEDLEDQGGLA